MTREKAEQMVKAAVRSLGEKFEEIDEIALRNQQKVLDAFRENAVQARHFYGSTGYGYDDAGRDTLGRVFARALGAESALVSPLISTGTQAITLMLFAALRPGDRFISASGKPYDTLSDVISGENCGSLADYGVSFSAVELCAGDPADPNFDFDAIKRELESSSVRAVFVGRSRGYEWRDAISVEKIADLVRFVKKISPETLILVDNCYGEFVEVVEPTDVGADLIAGSLIKNIGGGIAPTGGYVAGRAELVELAARRLTAPSLGAEVGSYISGYLPFYQGLFLAPQAVKNAVKSAYLFAKAFSDAGYPALPDAGRTAYDIVASIRMRSADELIGFCRAVQSVSPVDSNVVPEPWAMPGYQSDVIMAAGAFVQGSSIELSADSPIKEPYTVYVQGGLTFEHAVTAVTRTLERVLP